MPDNAELRREISVLREKQRAGEDRAMSEKRRAQELAAVNDQAAAARRNERGF